MTIATYAQLPAAARDFFATDHEAPVTIPTIRFARATSLSDRVWRSTMRFSYTFPRRTIVATVIMLRIILVAVPARRRVEPVITSGPTSAAMTTSAAFAGTPRRLH